MAASKKVQHAIKVAGGVNAVCREFGKTYSAVTAWGQRGIPVIYVKRLCEMTDNMFTPHDLRPDVFSKQ